MENINHRLSQAVSTRPQGRSRQSIRPLLLCSCYHLLFGGKIPEFQKFRPDLFLCRGRARTRGRATAAILLHATTRLRGPGRDPLPEAIILVDRNSLLNRGKVPALREFRPAPSYAFRPVGP